jgi:CHAT domain
MDLLELSILDSYSKSWAIGLGRHGSDIAIARIPLDTELRELQTFSDNLFDVLRGRGRGKKPEAPEVMDFGRKLFSFLIRDDIKSLYGRLPDTHVSLKILSNHGALRQLPWEYLQEPGRQCPRNGRSVVRIIPTIGLSAPDPLPKAKLAKILFVSADPIGIPGVSWEDIEQTLRRTYTARLGGLDLKVVEGSTRQSLLDVIQQGQFDVVHFSCHGEVVNGEGRLILVDRRNQKPDYILASELGRLLSNRGIRLVVLSACESSAATPALTFSNIAETLIQQGIPAVVANQAPVLNQTVAAFVGALYQELLGSGNIDMAVTAGRIALSMDLRESPEWGIPTLHRLYGAAQMYA